MEFCYPVNIINIRQEKTSSHLGLDLGFDSSIDKNSYNQDIINPFKGEVIYIKYQATGGYVIHIYSKELNLTSEFGHLKKGSIKVKLHQIVESGEVIAKMGNSGKASGYHLHYGLYKGKLNYNKKSFSKASIVKDYKLYNGDIVPLYEVDGKFALIDKVRGYYTSKNYL